DQAVLGLEEEFEVQYVLHGFGFGDTTQSAQLDIEFDANAFELATGDIATSFVPQALPIAVDDVTITGPDNGKMTVSVLLADPIEEAEVINGAPAYSLRLKVKDNAVTGSYAITTLYEDGEAGTVHVVLDNLI